ncbi:MAG: YbdD/YjiX family protein [Azospirillaceae bacterium]|nr:YbdD/YjiX family protein [Azospirillaceae bacterium]
MPDLSLLLRRLKQTSLLMVGVPDYDTYVAHRRANHPGQPVMSYPEFFRERQNSRYGGGDGKISRCC